LRPTKNDFLWGKLLGEGSYGEVWKAYFRKNEEFYAVKKIDKKRANNETIKKKLMREKDIMIKISHPNVLKLKLTF
jgi:serine/threonine protein kinase